MINKQGLNQLMAYLPNTERSTCHVSRSAMLPVSVYVALICDDILAAEFIYLNHTINKLATTSSDTDTSYQNITQDNSVSESNIHTHTLSTLSSSSTDSICELSQALSFMLHNTQSVLVNIHTAINQAHMSSSPQGQVPSLDQPDYAISVDDFEFIGGDSDTSSTAPMNTPTQAPNADFQNYSPLKKSSPPKEIDGPITSTSSDDASSMHTLLLAGGGVLLAGVAVFALSGSSGDDEPAESVSGCMNESACNYNASASIEARISLFTTKCRAR